MCIDKIFGKDNECETDNIDTIEVIEDGYTGYNPVIINDEKTNKYEGTVNDPSVGEVTLSNTTSIEQCVPKMFLNNVFMLGVDKMNDPNILKQRERKKNTLKRTNTFFFTNTRNNRRCRR